MSLLNSVNIRWCMSRSELKVRSYTDWFNIAILSEFLHNYPLCSLYDYSLDLCSEEYEYMRSQSHKGLIGKFSVRTTLKNSH